LVPLRYALGGLAGVDVEQRLNTPEHPRLLRAACEILEMLPFLGRQAQRHLGPLRSEVNVSVDCHIVKVARKRTESVGGTIANLSVISFTYRSRDANV
jgi:hypothetical protein